jgi:cellulose synthase operon protein YhjQ
MTNEDRKEQKLNAEAQALPDDVATLYSWANLHGAKYRDFSATRQEARSQARFRSQVEAPPAESPAPEETAIEAKTEAKAEADVEARQEPKAETRPVARAEPESAVRHAWEELIAPTPAEHASTAILPSLEEKAPGAAHHAPLQSPSHGPGQLFASPSNKPFAPPAHLYAYDQQAREPQPTERVSSRWYTLNSVLGQSSDALQSRMPAREFRIPVLAVFSLAGGVGKTGIVATLGRMLAAHGENVLLVDTNSYGLLPFYYGARDVRPGAVRTFSGGTTDASVQLLSLDVERYADDDRHSVADEIARRAQNANRILIDVSTASSSLTRQILRLSPRVLMPLVPDVSSLASLPAVDAFFARLSESEGRFVEPVYVLNRFDSSMPLHAEVNEILRQKLGPRLLPFALRRSPAVAEALAEGMTVVDYSPGAPVAEDYASLSSWIRNVAPPAGNALRGKRWSEQQPG